MEAKVSIIIPAYNAEKSIKKTIESILRQDYENKEIIIINDGSKDHTKEMLNDYKDRVMIINKENEGVSIARNLGIRLATGKYIIFVDADDICKDNEIITAVRAIENGDEDEVIFGMERAYKGVIKETIQFKNQIFIGKEIENNIGYIMEHGLGSPCNKIYLRENIVKWGIQFDTDLKLGEDMNFNINYLLRCKKIKYISDVLYTYCLENSISTTLYRPDMYEQRLMALRKMQDSFLKLKKVFPFYSISRMKLVYAEIFNLQHSECPLLYKEKIIKIKKIKQEYISCGLNDLKGINKYLDLLIKYLPSNLLYVVAYIIRKLRNRISVEKRGVSI